MSTVDVRATAVVDRLQQHGDVDMAARQDESNAWLDAILAWNVGLDLEADSTLTRVTQPQFSRDHLRVWTCRHRRSVVLLVIDVTNGWLGGSVVRALARDRKVASSTPGLSATE